MHPRAGLVRLLSRLAVPFCALAAGLLAFSLYAPVDDTVAAARTTVALPRPAPPRPPGVGPNLANAAAAGRPVRVGVFGDSFGDGIWWALDQQLRGDSGIELHRLSHASTGFTSYQLVNLLEDTRAKLDSQPLDIAIVSFGANDTQGINADGAPTQYMSEAWQRVIGARVDALIGLLRERGVQVYWVGLPRMRSQNYDERAQRMNQFFARRMRALNVPFIDTVPSTQDANGHFALLLPNPETGRPMPARTNDGIHMTMHGYGILTHGLAGRIRETIASAWRQAGRPLEQQAANPRTSGAGSRS